MPSSSIINANFLPTFFDAVDKAFFIEKPNTQQAAELNRTVGVDPDFTTLTRQSDVVEIRIVRGHKLKENKGASAQVYKAYSQSDKFLSPRIPFAVKKMNISNICGEDSGESTDFYELYNREIHAILELCQGENVHPNVIRFLGAFYSESSDSDRGNHWVTFEWCDGGNVTFVSNLDLNFDSIAAIAAGTINGLAYMNEKGFIHTDIKPDNLLLKSPGTLKICDFGLSSKVIGVTDPDYHALGTERYMSPELMTRNLLLEDGNHEEANEYHYSFNTDIWSLGITLLELVLGRCPLFSFRKIDSKKKHKQLYDFLFEMLDEEDPRNQDSGLYQIFRLRSKYRKRMAAHGDKYVDEDLKLLFDRYPYLETHCNIADDVKHIFSFKNHKFALCFDFIKICLTCKYTDRPDAKDLMKHPFVKNHILDINSCGNKMKEIEDNYSGYKTRKTFWKTYRGKHMKTLNEIIRKRNELRKNQIRQEKPESIFM